MLALVQSFCSVFFASFSLFIDLDDALGLLLALWPVHTSTRSFTPVLGLVLILNLFDTINSLPMSGIVESLAPIHEDRCRRRVRPSDADVHPGSNSVEVQLV